MGAHVQVEAPVGFDVGPEQRAERPAVVVGEPARPLTVLQHLLDEEGVQTPVGGKLPLFVKTHHYTPRHGSFTRLEFEELLITTWWLGAPSVRPLATLAAPAVPRTFTHEASATVVRMGLPS